MIVWLDHKIFGNGFGLGAPYWNQRYLWLTQDRKRGELYTFMHGLGAQLHSIQWMQPMPGETRILGGYKFKVFDSTRRWFRVQVSWSRVDLPKDTDKAIEALRQMEKDLGSNDKLPD